MDPNLFAEGPARDARFTIKERWTELRNLALDDPEHQLEFLHRQMNEEVNSIEISARNLADFPEADWELRMEMARQCWDEARHCTAFRELYEKRGGVVGTYPVLNFQFRIITNIRSLAGRLAVQNRSFEAAGIDAIEHEIQSFDRRRDPEYIALVEAQLADEMHHVRYGNEWVKRLVEKGGPRMTFEVARAVGQAGLAFQEVAGEAAGFYPVAGEARREAGFTEDEIEGARKLIPSH